MLEIRLLNNTTEKLRNNINEKTVTQPFFLFYNSLCNSATVQQNDVIEYKGIKSELDINWPTSSPLKAYFVNEKKDDYPFSPISTGNNRGYVAEWLLKDKRLYLSRVIIPNTFSRRKEKPKVIDIGEILPIEIISNNRAFAEWFTGPLLIKSMPFKQAYKAEDDGREYYFKDFREYTVVQVVEGTVVSEKSYDSDKFWSLTSNYMRYKSISEEDIAVISRFYGDQNRQLHKETESGEAKVVFSDDDFDFFLKRRLVFDVNIPLSEICIVKDVTINFGRNGWLTGKDFNIKKYSNILYLEMGSSNIPNGPWNDYTGGSVQVFIPFESKNGQYLLNVENTRYINNFASDKAKTSISADIDIVSVENHVAHLKGKIDLTSTDPETTQTVELTGKSIPVYSLLEYLKKHQNDNEYSRYDAVEVFKNIQSRSEEH